MHRFIPFILLFIPFNVIIGQNEIALDSTYNSVGKFVKVCSTVAGTFVTKGNSKVTILNIGEEYPKTKFSVVIYEKDLPNFAFIPSDYYKNKNVCITGTINIYKEKPQINARFPDQIEVVL